MIEHFRGVGIRRGARRPDAPTEVSRVEAMNVRGVVGKEDVPEVRIGKEEAQVRSPVAELVRMVRHRSPKKATVIAGGGLHCGHFRQRAYVSDVVNGTWPWCLRCATPTEHNQDHQMQYHVRYLSFFCCPVEGCGYQAPVRLPYHMACHLARCHGLNRSYRNEGVEVGIRSSGQIPGLWEKGGVTPEQRTVQHSNVCVYGAEGYPILLCLMFAHYRVFIIMVLLCKRFLRCRKGCHGGGGGGV